MHILFACRKFGGVIGGVERMAITLMNEMVDRGHKVTLFTWDDNNKAETFYKLDERIDWIKLAMGNPAELAGLSLRLKRMVKVRSILREIKPDVIIGFQEGPFITMRLYSIGQGIPVICAIRNSPNRDSSIPVYPPTWFIHTILRLANVITLQFDRYSDLFPSYLKNKFVTIPNHVIPAKSFAKPDADIPRKTILATGRLSPEKNHAVLIEAFAKIASDFPDWELSIVGRGDLEIDLKEKIKVYEPSISNRIFLLGPSDDVPSLLIKSHLFCLPSYWEGFPNSLSEAMAHGLPCIGFRDCDGVKDLIDDGVTGLLADGLKNADTLADKLKILMANPRLRREMGEAGVQSVRKYDMVKVFDMWENLFLKVIK